MLFHKHNMPLNLSSGLRMIRWGISAPRPSWARLACTNASAGPDTMQLQREDLIAQTEQYDTNTMQSQCEDLIAGTEQCSTMQSQCEDLIASTEQCSTMQSQCEDLIQGQNNVKILLHWQNNTVQCNCNVEILLQGQNNVKIYIELKSEHHWAAAVTRHQISLPGPQWCNIPNITMKMIKMMMLASM